MRPIDGGNNFLDEVFHQEIYSYSAAGKGASDTKKVTYTTNDQLNMYVAISTFF